MKFIFSFAYPQPSAKASEIACRLHSNAYVEFIFNKICKLIKLFLISLIVACHVNDLKHGLLIHRPRHVAIHIAFRVDQVGCRQTGDAIVVINLSILIKDRRERISVFIQEVDDPLFTVSIPPG